MFLSNSPQINDMGEIQPCHMPQKKPAGFEAVYVPSPGTQPVNKNKINTPKENNTIFFLTVHPHFCLKFLLPLIRSVVFIL